MKTKLLFCSIIILFAGCRQNSPVYENATDVAIADFKKVEAVSPSEIYGTEPAYIRLETTDSALFSFRDIEKVVIEDNLIYILESTFKKLIVYDMDGAPVKVIDYRGRGPKEYLQITDFDVDKDGYIWIADAQKNVLYKYGKDCKVVSAQLYPYEVNKIRCLDSGGFIFQIGSWDDSYLSGCELVVADSSLNVKSKLLKYPKDKNMDIVFKTTISDNGEDCFYMDPISDYLFNLSSDGEISAIYHLDFGSRTVPDDIRKDIGKNYSRLKNYSFAFSSYKVTPSFITFGVIGKDWSSAVIDRNKKEIAYFDFSASAFRLAGQYSGGSIWQVLDVTDKKGLPENVAGWLEEGYDVLMLTPYE